jgi:hypothetical protein
MVVPGHEIQAARAVKVVARIRDVSAHSLDQVVEAGDVIAEGTDLARG